MLALPGSAYVYQGEELGLEQVDVHPDHRQDPAFLRTGEAGRDGCRVPMPWSGEKPPFGFGPGDDQPWLPMPESWTDLTVEAQEDDPASTLTFYRALLAMRREVAAGLPHDVTMLRSAPGSLAFRRGEPGVVCMLTCGTRPARVPDEAGELLMTSGDGLLDGPGGARLLPSNTAAWFRTA
jgi:alpha-glucosidase